MTTTTLEAARSSTAAPARRAGSARPVPAGRPRSGRRPLTTRLPRLTRAFWLEVALLAGLYVAYSVSRTLIGGDPASAFAHGRDLLDLERRLGLAVEEPLNDLVTAVPLLGILAAYWYALLHYVVTPVALVLVHRRGRATYPRLRTALIVTTLLGVLGFWLYPTAPPRLLPEAFGFTDTLAATSHWGWWGAEASAPRGLGGMTNQFAAMPSLHVGWAAWVAWAAFATTRRRWVRVLATTYAVGTGVVVVVTANHYVVDALAGLAVLASGAWVAGRLARRRG